MKLLFLLAVLVANPWMALANVIPPMEDFAHTGEGSDFGFEFTGPVEAGGPNVTLYGDAVSIYRQMLKLNPKYNPEVFPEYKARRAELEKRLVEIDTDGDSVDEEDEEEGGEKGRREETTNIKRQDKPKKGGTRIDCNIAGEQIVESSLSCGEGAWALRNLHGYCKAPKGYAGCARLTCSNDCGIYLCNDNNHPIYVWCGNLYGDYIALHRKCHTGKPRDRQRIRDKLKGVIYRETAPGWNVKVKKSNCAVRHVHKPSMRRGLED